MSKSKPTTPSAAYPTAILVLTMGLSTWLNVVHALSSHADGTPWRNEMAVMSAIPPILLPLLVELLGREARRGAASKGLFRSAFGVITALAALAFAISVWSISALGIAMGLPGIIAIAFPTVLDLAAAASTLFLLDRALGEQRSASTVLVDQDHSDADTAVDQSADLPSYPMLDPNRWDRGPLSDLDRTLDMDLDMDQNAKAREVHAPADPQVRADQDQPAEQVHAEVDQVADQSEDQDHEPAVQPAEGQADQDADLAPDVLRPTTPAVRAAPSTVDREPVQITESDLDRARAILNSASMSYSVDQVAAVLALLDAGTASRAIAEQTGISKSGVLRIKSAARELSVAA